jgi:Rha family phage regulatory protein
MGTTVFPFFVKKVIMERQGEALVFIGDDATPRTSSRIIAEVFQKRHSHVVRDIRKLLNMLCDGVAKDMAAEFLNLEQAFNITTYTDNYGREQPEYLLNEVGFQLLVMRFSGISALRQQLLFVCAFMEMRKKVATLGLAINLGMNRSNLLVSRSSKKQQTYFLLDRVTGLLKIGRSVDVGARQKTIQATSSNPLDLVLTIEKDVEHKLHKQFKKYRLHNEWFRYEGDLKTYVEGYENSVD